LFRFNKEGEHAGYTQRYSASVVVIALYAFTAMVNSHVVLDALVAQPMFARIVWLSVIVYALYHEILP